MEAYDYKVLDVVLAGWGAAPKVYPSPFAGPEGALDALFVPRAPRSPSQPPRGP